MKIVPFTDRFAKVDIEQPFLHGFASCLNICQVLAYLLQAMCFEKLIVIHFARCCDALRQT